VSLGSDQNDHVEKPGYRWDSDSDGYLFSRLAASACEDVEWINKLMSWVADVATNKPQIKIIGMPNDISPPDLLVETA
jgi:hypothetical protein